MSRHRDVNWNLPDNGLTWEHVAVAVLMDIRTEVQGINAKLGCYRIPIALDALRDLGKEARRRDKARRARNKKARKAK